VNVQNASSVKGYYQQQLRVQDSMPLQALAEKVCCCIQKHAMFGFATFAGNAQRSASRTY
jgi:hypothetical protein